MSKFENPQTDFLMNYVPDVYQPDIYAIDYRKLKDAGIKLISFDIDDTIAGLATQAPPKTAVTLFADLKNQGFELMLLTNARDDRGETFADALGISDHYIARAEKPLTTHFETLQKKFELEKSQMAHVGNSIMNDVAGGNAFGITTCLVRRAGITGGVGKRLGKLVGMKTQGHNVREKLLEQGIWRKHHMNEPGDQYYQLGELPLYQQKQDGAEAADLIRRIK